jgi:hypothetical protein
MDRARLDSNIDAIRKYRDENPVLLQAHHFLYDLPLRKDAGRPEVVVMGINPGETQFDRDACPYPTEETWQHDFHATSKSGRSQGSVRWRRNMDFFACGYPVIQTELFFWSSNNQSEFNERFGPLWKSQHLRFCVDMNRSLLDVYKPRFVIFVGLSDSARVALEFGLRLVSSVREHGQRLVVHYEDDHRPWFFTKHWSGSFGFSQNQKDQIRTYIQGHASASLEAGKWAL